MTSVAAIYLGHAVSDPSRTLVFKHQRTAKAVWTEMALQRALSSSPYTLPLLDRFTHPSGIFMVLPYCDQGDLFDEIIRVHADPSACSREDRAAWASSRLLTLLQAVAYMHGEGIFHRDLKPENILLYRSILLQSPSSAWGKAGGHPLISDFGIATRDPTASVRGFGSEFYMCPEALMDADSYRTCPLSTVPAAAADVWSLGVIALNLFTGRNPWAKADATTDAGYAAFLQDPWALMEMHGLSEAVGSLLIRMLCPDPRRRATISE
ncbi:kinase-like domain-containing protein, partial [Piptocephalis cylindrospora]